MNVKTAFRRVKLALRFIAPLTIALARSREGWTARIDGASVTLAARFIAADRLAARIDGEAGEVRGFLTRKVQEIWPDVTLIDMRR